MGAGEDGVGDLAIGGISEEKLAGPDRGRGRKVAEHFLQIRMELRGFGGGLAAREDGGVGVQEDEEWSWREEFAALAEQVGKGIFHLPQFAFGTAAEARRIEDEAVIGAATAEFARDKGLCVVDEPTDGAVSELRKRLIFAGPLDGFAGSVHVSDVRSGSGAREGGEAGVAEQRQNFWRCRGGLDGLGEPVPVAGLIGKNAEVAGRRGLDPESKIVAAHGPARGNGLRKSPLAIF